MDSSQLLMSQKIISTKNFQSKFAAMVKKAQEDGSYYNVIRNSESVGVFLPTELWESLLEDIEALHSPAYLAKIKASRHEAQKKKLVDMNKAFRA